jgi:hypothetical protein
MIIQFNKNLALSDWYIYGSNSDQLWLSAEKIWCRDKIVIDESDDLVIVVARKNPHTNECYVNFYNKLYHLHDYFPIPANRDNVENYKRYVDEFLMRMSKLNIFE